MGGFEEKELRKILLDLIRAVTADQNFRLRGYAGSDPFFRGY